jgi:hypothetical protein
MNGNSNGTYKLMINIKSLIIGIAACMAVSCTDNNESVRKSET